LSASKHFRREARRIAAEAAALPKTKINPQLLKTYGKILLHSGGRTGQTHLAQ
jgi:hypothetical protein